MRAGTLLFLFLLGLGRQARGQQTAPIRPDTLLMRDGQKIKAHVLLITETELRFRQDNLPGNTFRAVPLRLLDSVYWHDGRRQAIPKAQGPADLPPQQAAAPPAEPAPASAGVPMPYVRTDDPQERERRFNLGKAEGQAFYTGWEPAAIGTGLGTATGILPGFIVWAATRNIPLKSWALGIGRDNPYYGDTDYLRGYHQAAVSVKRRHTGMVLRTGIGVWAAVVVLGGVLVLGHAL